MGRRKSRPQPPSPSANAVADKGNAVSDYEQQRLSRIRENRARLEALGLPNLASSLLGSQQSPNRQASRDRKRKNIALDDDYQPSDDGESSSSEEESEEGKYSSPAPGSRRKGKQKISNATEVKCRSSIRKTTRESDAIDDDDDALQQAISLSLGEAKEDSGTVYRGLSQNSGSNVDHFGSRAKKSKANIKGNVGRRNIRKESKSRVQLTEDEVVAYFFSFDEAGKGHITLRDLQKKVAAHDFTWTDTEIAHMIHSFDSDGDGKLSLAEFQTIVTRCHMLQNPNEC